MIGLKRGIVTVVDHQTDQNENASAITKDLKEVFGDTVLDIQHISMEQAELLNDIRNLQ